jgi:hypothetical protein
MASIALGTWSLDDPARFSAWRAYVAARIDGEAGLTAIAVAPDLAEGPDVIDGTDDDRAAIRAAIGRLWPAWCAVRGAP